MVIVSIMEVSKEHGNILHVGRENTDYTRLTFEKEKLHMKRLCLCLNLSFRSIKFLADSYNEYNEPNFYESDDGSSQTRSLAEYLLINSGMYTKNFST